MLSQKHRTTVVAVFLRPWYSSSMLPARLLREHAHCRCWQGADILSKWVGEAERMLRLLFAEAERCQPSIIFFDELDGLAPVSTRP